jgi:hypothetical protein
MLYAFIFPVRDTCNLPFHLCDLITLVIFGEVYKLLGLVLCSLSQHPVTSSSADVSLSLAETMQQPNSLL